MNQPGENPVPRLPVELERRVDHVCRQFEAAWRLGHRPSIEEYLGTAQGTLRTLLLSELLGLELELRQADGERPTVWQYRVRFPQHVDLIQKFFSELGHAGGSSPRNSAIWKAGVEPIGARRIDRPVSSPRPAYHLGRYRIVRKLGEGWFGQSFLAHDQELVRDVVLKIANDRLLSPLEAQRFLRDSRVLTELNHPHVAPVFDAGIDDTGRRFMVTRPLFGPNLAQRIALGSVDLETRLAWAVEIAEALQYAQEQGLLHGDLRPGNVILDEGDRLLLVDFALSMTDDDFQHAKLTANDLAYLSPERVAGEDHRVGGASDVFSLGVLLYWLITDRLPFNASAEQPLRQLHARWSFPEPGQLVSELPAGLNRVCLRALARRAADRFPTPGHLAEALRRVVSGRASHPLSLVESPDGPPPAGLRSWEAEDTRWFPPTQVAWDVEDLPSSSLNFWIERLGALDQQDACDLSVLYGPGGSGKTSLIRAGVIPRLPREVLPVCVVANSRDTDRRILSALLAACPELPASCDAPGALALIRQGHAARGWSKVVLVVDQFERCLSVDESAWEPLAASLRQADGPRLACLLVTDDRDGLRLHRFLHQLEVVPVESRNVRGMELPTLDEARRFLIRAGQATGHLPRQESRFEPTHRELIEWALSEFTRRPTRQWARLAMIRTLLDRGDWRAAPPLPTSVDLELRFLDAVLLEPSAGVPRPDRKVVVGLVASLVDETSIGSDREPISASTAWDREKLRGYLDWLADGAGILTRASREDEGGVAGDGGDVASGYVLAHDFLRDGLRSWLLREQLCDARLRARLLLAAYATAWEQTADPACLPGTGDWLRIRLAVNSTTWNRREAALMHRAGQRHVVRLIGTGLASLAAICVGAAALVAALAAFGKG